MKDLREVGQAAAVRSLETALLCCSLAACSAPTRGPYYGDDKLLRFGVDPHAEAAEVRAALERAGHRMVERQAGPAFTAFSFRGPDGRPSAVRIVSVRGIVLALDSQRGSALTVGTMYSLLPRPIAGTFDADGDGFDELFAVQTRPHRTCVLVYRVRAGFVDPVEPDLSWAGDGACVEQVSDRDGDGRVELITTWTITGLPIAVQPSVEVALFPERHDYVLTSPGAYYADAVAVADIELLDAQSAADAERAYGIAVRIAGLLAVSGFDVDAQVGRLQEAFEGLPTSARNLGIERRLLARVRAGLLADDDAARGDG